jgi:long-chain acyl-CoA synthetase
MLFGDNRAHNVAIVVPNMEGVNRWAKQQHKTIGDPTTDPDVKALLQSELDRLSQSFKSYERPKNVLVVSEDFTVQNGLLTPSLKVKRRTVVAKYERALAALY